MNNMNNTPVDTARYEPSSNLGVAEFVRMYLSASEDIKRTVYELLEKDIIAQNSSKGKRHIILIDNASLRYGITINVVPMMNERLVRCGHSFLCYNRFWSNNGLTKSTILYKKRERDRKRISLGKPEKSIIYEELNRDREKQKNDNIALVVRRSRVRFPLSA